MATRETGGGNADHDVRNVAAAAKEDVRNATDRILDRGRDEARTILEQQQRRAADGLTGVADALHAAADRMEGGDIGFVARYAETAAAQVESWARRVQQRDIDDVLSEAETHARRNPEIFVGGAFIAGFLVARVAKASSDRRRLRERIRRQAPGGGDNRQGGGFDPHSGKAPEQHGTTAAGMGTAARPTGTPGATPTTAAGPGPAPATVVGGTSGRGDRT